MSLMKIFNEDTQKWEPVDSGAVSGNGERVTPSQIMQLRREAVHSGFLNYATNDFEYLSTTPNTIRLAKDVKVNLNGYFVKFDKGTNILFPEAPLTGRRTDLIYIKAVINDKGHLTGGSIETVTGKEGLSDIGYARDSEDKGLWKKGNDLAVLVASVERRNSGGYSEQNVDGSMDFIGRRALVDHTHLPANATGQLVEFTEPIRHLAKIGDIWYRDGSSANGFAFRVVGFTSNPNQLIVDNLAGVMSMSDRVFYPASSGRPDSLYSNIIDQRDIIDLRHKVSLTGENYQQLLEENFDKLLRGELRTKEQEVMQKEYFGLKEAFYSDLSQLMPVKTNTPEGDKWLVNMLGMTGSTATSRTITVENSGHYLFFKYHRTNGTTSYNKYTNQTSLSLTWSANERASLYKISQSDFDKIDVLPEFTGEELAKRFPYVDSVPNVVENLARLVSTTDTNWVEVANYNDLIVGQTYRVKTLTNRSKLSVTPFSSGSDTLFDTYTQTITFTFTQDAKDKQMKLFVRDTIGDLNKFQVELVKGSQPNPVYVPYGQHYLSHDYATQRTPNRFDLSNKRQILSDAQTSENVHDIISPESNSHLPHISTEQAEAGKWSVGDKITVKSTEAVMTGVVDADTGVARVVRFVSGGLGGTNAVTLELNDVSKITIGDNFRILYISDTNVSSLTYTVTSVDTQAKQVSFTTSDNFGGNVESFITGSILYETTASTSSPNVTATGATGTWTGLGTREIVYTISTAPTNNKTDILLNYSMNYPSGKGIKHVPSEVLEAEVNGQKLTKQGNTVTVSADFNGKVSGNTDRVAHHSRVTAALDSTSLQNPNLGGNELSTSQYSSFSYLNNLIYALSRTGNGEMAQHRFSFSIIRLIEDKFSKSFFADCLTTADKVNKLRAKVGRVIFTWWGYGSSPSGNKASITTFKDGVNWDDLNRQNHINPTILNRNQTISNAFSNLNPNRTIDSSGLVHFLAYADPSDGTTASTIHTDYVKLDVEVNVAEEGYEVLQPVHKMPVLSDSPLLHKEGENLIPPFTDARWTLHANARALDNPYELELNATGAWQGSAIFIPCTPNTTYTYNVSHNGGHLHLLTRETESGSNLQNWNPISSNPFTFTTHANARFILVTLSNATTGTFTFKQPKLELGSTATPFTPSKIRNKRRILFNFRGKVAGSTWENPHRHMRRTLSQFNDPMTFGVEANNLHYTSMSKVDGDLSTLGSSTAGNFAQQLFEFDLSHLGLSLKELKEALRRLTVRWTGFGKGDNNGVLTYGSEMRIWRASTNTWGGSTWSIANSQPTTFSANISDNAFITKDQKVYILVHSTHPAGTASPSEIYTDYIELEVELSEQVDYVPSNIVKIQKNTKSIKLEYPTNKSNQVALWYKHTPQQKISTLATPKDLTSPNHLTISTVGSGKYSNEVNHLAKQILAETHGYLGESLHTFVNKGLKKLPLELDTLQADKPNVNSAYLITAAKIVERDSELYLRIIFQESKNATALLNPNNFADFRIEGRPLIKI